MKKLLPLLIALLIILCAVPASAFTEADFEKSDIPMGQTIKDFSATTLDGETFHLEDALKEKSAVLINLFKVDCPFCVDEFSLFNTLSEKYGDKVAFLALDANQYDTEDYIRELRDQQAISIPMAKEPEDMPVSDQIPFDGFPCTVVLDRNGDLVFYQDYAIRQAEDLDEVFDAILADDYEKGYQLLHFYLEMFPMDDVEDDTEANGYLLVVTDQNGIPVPGVFINFCSETQMTCRMEQTNEYGMIFFEVPEDRYHVQFLSVPEGYSFDPDFEAYTESSYGEPVWLEITKD